MFAADFLNICQVHIYPDICSPREAVEYQNYNISTATARASIAVPPAKLLLHVYLPKKKSQTRFKTFHQHLMLIAQVQGRFFKRRKLKGGSVSSYLIFVIFFTRANFLENKIYTEIYTVNCQFTQ